MAIDTEKQRGKLDRMMTSLAKEQAKLLLAEKAEQRRLQREAARARLRERAVLFRSADAHRKIVLGGLIIAAGTDEWNPAEIVGALLLVDEQLAQHPGRREQLRQKGIQHLEEREAARAAARS